MEKRGKNMKRMLKKSKGFTLVELLIVVVIIGILAGMMMLSMGGATAKAEATKILSDMRNVKAAAVMYYADNGTWPNNAAITAKSLDIYLDQPVTSDMYSFAGSDDKYLGRKVGETEKVNLETREQLAKLAGKAALYSDSDSSNTRYDKEDTVYMPVH